MTAVAYIAALLAVAVVVWMLIKKMDIKISLFLMGIVLMYVALFMGKEISVEGFKTTGIKWLDPFQAVADQFLGTLTSAGFIILILGGYTSYMSHIGANKVTVSVLSKPIMRIKSTYILVPITFLLGNLLSLMIPSASNLSIILLATLFPILRQAGMSTLSAGAVIATSATIVPTPLGSDNVAVAGMLAKTSQFSGLTTSDYVFRYHALISIPTLIVIAVVHYFWQKYLDKKAGGVSLEQIDIETAQEAAPEGGKLFRTVYALLPLLPIFILLAVFAGNAITGSKVNLSVALASILSFVVAVICELIRSRQGQETLKGTDTFFTGMGGAMPIVALLVAASIFVAGLQSIGIIASLQEVMKSTNGSGMGFVLPLILVALTALIVILSGSGTALFFAMVPLMVPLAAAAGINVLAVSVPMGLAGNLLRAVSPVSAVIMIVSGSIKKSPMELVKRTSVPMVAGLVFMFVLSMVVFLPMGTA
ncbi:C4-dicarboxylate ABC transporter [Bombiscardovia apis]|uniref:C4-dicarboxylate ABC transporter n=1 Tax=Bombiscardovia apis TaxID=2932182 RepID=A0ABN6SG64_9BIFI|nr:C4-dicarboxylate transporter DcuC [Bombiscardovia apis]BDR53901.1 C4-dicarboxylate ABC transporter [Bombiscardovia apis]